ncbi:MAG TPA: hypothetical protein VJ521_09160, partial [Acidobacteriota bacterium]|nr:hypothetical protein [Acidobacteriota bacterium]
KDSPPMPRSLNPRISEEMERLICKALEKKPEDRFTSCAELKMELNKAVGMQQTDSAVSEERAASSHIETARS